MAADWYRLELDTQARAGGGKATMEPGLEARVADPLWLLARQWQLAEFRGEDAGSPIETRLRTATTRPTRYHSAPRLAAGAQTRAIDADRPLEVHVEAEDPRRRPSAFRRAAEAGLDFLRLLDAQGGGELVPALRGFFPLLLPPPDLALTGPAENRRLTLMIRRAVDGQAIHRRLSENPDLDAFPSERPLSPGLRKALKETIRIWLERYADRFSEPETRSAWRRRRLEYSFSLAAPSPEGEVVLVAPEYPGGHLDWYHFDVAESTQDYGAGDHFTEEPVQHALPTAIDYRGKPAPRWWEMEDRQVNFAQIALGGEADLARALLIEFGAVFGDDWFLVPLDLTVPCLSRILELQVIDTFGEVHTILSVVQLEHPRPWRFWELSGDPGPAAGLAPWVWIPPALADSQESEPLERVAFYRDEMANLAWAVESRVEGPYGAAIDRQAAWTAARDRFPAPPPHPDDEPDLWLYRPEQGVPPPFWVPLVPERAEGRAEILLRRGRMAAWDRMPEAHFPGAHGRILDPGNVLRVREEEVPRGGVEVIRSFQLARWTDGSVHLWLGRRKRPSGGDPSSGLRWDQIERSR